MFIAERQVFEPITLTTYATMSYIPKFQIGNETVTIFRRWACPTLTAVCLPNFRYSICTSLIINSIAL